MRQFGTKQCLKSYCKIFILVLLFLASSAVEVVKSYNVLLGDKLNRSIKVRKYRDKGTLNFIMAYRIVASTNMCH